MLNTKEDIEELYQRTLCIAASRVLMPLPVSISFVKEQAFWQAGFRHVFRSGKKGSYLLVEHHRLALFVHAFQEMTNFYDGL